MKTILVVDDEESVRKLVVASLRKQDFRILHAETGEQALVLAAQEHPDLILMDIFLANTDLDGLAVSEEIKAHPETSDCMIILMSGRKTGLSKEKCLEVGAHSFFRKPFSPLELRQQIISLLA